MGAADKHFILFDEAILGLAPVEERSFKQRVDHDELEIALLNLLLDSLAHTLVAESDKDDYRGHNAEQNVQDRDRKEKI